ncbi:antibiotic biosynthesis monooxygenase [Pendulispora brunnea]|uniref:Antibiotic biosynthesis monooxygenase n=1 Tax=Pendulispora brunnea TaxID=2905690 RepID=A0ABZ2K717_9BACT
MSNTLTVIAYLHAKPGQEKKLLDELVALQEASIAEPGCISYQPYVEGKNPHRVAVVEEWKDRAALNAHFETPHFQRFASTLEQRLAEPFVIKYFASIEG